MEIILQTSKSAAKVSLLGGMTTAWFTLNHKTIHPFYENPWEGSFSEDPFLDGLKGDFFCLPFGGPPKKDELDKSWYEDTREPGRPFYNHGYSCHGTYMVTQQAPSYVVMELPYPDPDIRKVERRITLKEDRILFEDIVYPLKDTQLPVGVHPIFRLPQKAGMFSVIPPAAQQIQTYPIPVDRSSIFQNNAVCSSIHSVPLNAGGILDASSLPLAENTEELLFLAGVKEGKTVLHNKEESVYITLEWETQAYNSLLLWFSNRGRSFAPWSGHNLCLGMEPVTAAFDLGEAISTAANPLTKEGITTCYSFKKNTPVSFRHTIQVESDNATESTDY